MIIKTFLLWAIALNADLLLSATKQEDFFYFIKNVNWFSRSLLTSLIESLRNYNKVNVQCAIESASDVHYHVGLGIYDFYCLFAQFCTILHKPFFCVRKLATMAGCIVYNKININFLISHQAIETICVKTNECIWHPCTICMQQTTNIYSQSCKQKSQFFFN